MLTNTCPDLGNARIEANQPNEAGELLPSISDIASSTLAGNMPKSQSGRDHPDLLMKG